jgi:hypothetical protein
MFSQAALPPTIGAIAEILCLATAAFLLEAVVAAKAVIPPLPLTALFAMCAAAISGGILMADHSPAGPVETGAKMDYSEHEKTYAGFLTLAKYGSLSCIALLAAMAFGFFAGGGFFSGTVLFAAIMAAGYFALR